MVTALLGQYLRVAAQSLALVIVVALAPLAALAAPYAAIVMDARTGEVLLSENADTRLHPASLTKMMTLYIAFEAIERGEITLDTKVTVSKHAAAQPPSKLGLKAGQKIALRYLIRAAAIKSANDAATAIGEAIEGSEPAFAKRMNRTAKALGMSRSTFRNANGLTAEGHLSTARDMNLLGRHLFYDYPQYYNIFSRRTADAGIAQVASTNRRFLDSYEGADGIKTGYTSPAGFNLTASALRGNKRIIATIFGGRSTAQRNSKMAELLDIGFGKAPNRATVQKPPAPVYMAEAETAPADDDVAAAVAEAVADADFTKGRAAGKTIRLLLAVEKSPRPRARPAPDAPAPEAAPAEEMLLAMQDDIDAVLAAVQEEVDEPAFEQTTAPQPETVALAEATAGPGEAPEEDLAVTPGTLAVASAVMPDLVQVTAPQPETLAMAAIAPQPRPQPAAAASAEPAAASAVAFVAVSPATQTLAPAPRPEQIVLASLAPDEAVEEAPLEVVTRISTSGGRQWAINVGSFSSRYLAERMLLQTALTEMNTLDEALRKVVARNGAFDATFVGMTRETAELACRRLAARDTACTVTGP